MKQFDQIVLGSLDVAQSEVLKRRHTEMTVYHLLWGLVSHPQSKSHVLLADQKATIDGRLAKYATASEAVAIDQIRTDSKLSEWLTLASAEAVAQGRKEVSENDLLRTLSKVASDIKVKLDDLANAEAEGEIPAFLTDLNARAREGKLDPVIGRSREIRAVIEILGRRNKNNPVLVGPAGVGKTAIVEGLADQIVAGKVPDVLQGKVVYNLDMGSLMAGTKFRGEFEERLQALLKFIKGKQGQALLFIDEIHQLVGAGRTDGAMDAANLLKPALARGELHCIGATTPDEFQKYIMEDPALERRFRPVPVGEPSQEDAIEILMGIRDKHEMHHGIKISDEALYSAVKLSSRYITDKNLPDKAIDLIDEAASSLKLSAEAMPAELEQMEAEIRNKRILAKVEKDNTEIIKEADALESKFSEGKKVWEESLTSLRKLSSVKNALDRAKFELGTAEREGKLEEASRIKYSVVPELEKQLAGLQHGWVLGRDHVASVVARQTGIPLEKILKNKQENLLELEPYLTSRVFGQKEALHEMAETLLTAYAGLSDESRPLGSFLLKGPTGVGKTESCKALTKYLFDLEENMVRIDMSEYSQKHEVAKLIGAPAGYIGYDHGGVLTEAVRRRPYALILFDEIEKAHPDFSDILLQILDDGRLTDNKGRTVDFRNTIIAMTTNSQDLRRDFKPEVLGRIDAILEFQPLGEEVVEQLIDAQLHKVQDRLKSKHVRLTLTPETRQKIKAQGYDPQYGARPLRSAFDRIVARPLAKKILAGELEEGDLVV